MSTEMINILLNTFGVAAVAALVGIVKVYINHNETIKQIAEAVKAADQLWKNKTGPEKKEWVIEQIRSLCNSKWLTEERLNLLIEAAVAEWKKH